MIVMANQNNANTNTVLTTCTVCKQTGSCGAKWLFYVGEHSQPNQVHTPCGEMLLRSAPAGVKAKLVPSRVLREEWRTKRLTQDFWDSAFGKATPLRAKATLVA